MIMINPMAQYDYMRVDARSHIKEHIHMFLDRLPDDPKTTTLKVFPEYGLKLIRLADRCTYSMDTQYQLLNYWNAFYVIFQDNCKELHAGPEITTAGFKLYQEITSYIQPTILFS